MASPLVDIPFSYFFFATLIGLVPANVIHISTGATLSKTALRAAHASDDTNDGRSYQNNALNFAILFGLQFVALLPTLFKSKLQAYDARPSTTTTTTTSKKAQ
jgi:hypothetical protein